MMQVGVGGWPVEKNYRPAEVNPAIYAWQQVTCGAILTLALTSQNRHIRTICTTVQTRPTNTIP